MNMRRSFMLACATALSVIAFGAGSASAQDYPNRPIKVMIGFPAGSGADIITRFFSEKLAEASGQTVIVENKPGASSTIAVSGAAHAKPDGYTILFGIPSAMVAGKYLFKNLQYDTEKDFVMAAAFADIPFILAVGPENPSKDVAEFVAYLKAKKQTTYGASSQFAVMASELFKVHTGTESEQVLYKVTADAVVDVTNKSLDYMMIDGSSAFGPARANKIKLLATSSPKRIPSAPELPTMEELGFKGFDITSWWGMYLPAGTPPDVVAKLGAWMNKISASDDAKKFMDRISGSVLVEDGPTATARLKREIAKFGEVVKRANIQAQ